MHYTFRRLAPTDEGAALPAILELVAAEATRSGSHLVTQSPAFYARHFRDGEVFAAYAGERLVAFSLLGYGSELNPIWGPILDQLGARASDVGVFIHALVDPEHRGRQLGARLHTMKLLHAVHRGLTHALATVHPDNAAGVRTLLAAGFVERDRRVVYEARVLRAFYTRTLSRPTLRAPRLPLCALPTAIEALPRVSAALGGPQLFVKREDQVGLATGGNKSRMLELLIADALEKGARTLITRGHRLSNHCRQVAAAAARLGLRAHLVLRGSPSPAPAGNELLDRLLGATITWTEGRDPDQVLDEVERAATAAGEAPYRIAYGGADALGAAAYAEALREVVADGRRFDRLFVAASSGTTQAGLVAGALLDGVDVTIVGVSVDEPAATVRRNVARLAAQVGPLYGVGPLPIDAAGVEVDDRQIDRGYGVVGAGEREAIALLAREEGLLLDPVYTARAFAGLIDRIRRGAIRRDERVLFVHTGGLPSLFALGGDVLGDGAAA